MVTLGHHNANATYVTSSKVCIKYHSHSPRPCPPTIQIVKNGVQPKIVTDDLHSVKLSNRFQVLQEFTQSDTGQQLEGMDGGCGLKNLHKLATKIKMSQHKNDCTPSQCSRTKKI